MKKAGRKARTVLYDSFNEKGDKGIRIIAEEYCYRLEVAKNSPSFFEDLGILISTIPLEKLRNEPTDLAEIPQKLAEYKKEIENIVKEISGISQQLLENINERKE